MGNAPAPRQCPLAWAEPIEAWLLTLHAAGRPATTIALRRYQLTRAAHALARDPWDVTGDHLTGWIGRQTWKAETLRSWRAALRGFYGWAVETGRTTTNPATSLPRVKPAVPDPHPTPDSAVRWALAISDKRARLMIRLAGELGLRRGEVARIHRRDIVEDLIGWTLDVHGKGNRPRAVPMPDDLAQDLRAACERNGGWAFPGDDHGHLSPQRVGRIVSAVLPDGWTMHSLRHRFATRAYAVEHDLLVVQQLLGHASPVTTRVYVKVPRDALRRTVLAAA